MKKNFQHKYILAGMFMALMLAQSFSDYVIIAGYYLNTKAYTAYCINKASPQMHCNGKCQLMKKITNTEKNNAQIPSRKNDASSTVLFSRTYFQVAIAGNHKNDKPLYSNLFFYKPQHYALDIFHPPSTLFL